MENKRVLLCFVRQLTKGDEMEKDIFYDLKYFNQLVKKRICKNGDKKPVDITSTQMLIVDYLINNDNVTQKQIELFLRSSRATVSDVLKTMEKNNIIEKKACDVDSRTNIICLTEASRGYIDSFKNKFDVIKSEILDGISEKELEEFNRILSKMINNLEGNDN